MISLYDILDAANGQLFGEPGAQLFSEFCFDSRLASESCLYVALKAGGQQYMMEAISRGAAGILCTRPPEFETAGVSILLVKDVSAALLKWSRYVLQKFSPKIVAVSGTSGRSITVEAISHVLATRYTVHHGSGGGQLSLPVALSKLASEHQMVVLELAAEAPGDMADLVEIVQPQVSVITRIGSSDRFETVEQLVQETGLLVERLPADGLAVLSYDDDRTRAMAQRSPAPSVTVGLEGFGADLTAYNVVVGATGTGFDVRHGTNRHVGRWSPLLGTEPLYGVLAALAVGMQFDIAPADALKALTSLSPLPGQMNPLNGLEDSLLVDDSFSADPETTLAALDWLRAVKDENHRAIFVFGDMDGEPNQRGHRAVGQRAAEAADLFITVGPDAALAGRAALDQGMDAGKVHITYGIEDAVAQLKALTSNDIVLIKGGAGARTELITRALLADEADANQLVRGNQVSDSELRLRPIRSSWVDVDLEALANNVRGIKQMIGDSVTLFAVVKANAYGHGAVPVARTALLNGAECLSVASISEAIELRGAGISAPILVMSYTAPQAVRQAVRQNITLTVYDIELARAYDLAARAVGGKLKVHLKVDTGMGRLGVLAAEAMPFFRAVLGMDHLDIEGIYTHFSQADDDLGYTREQIRTFRNVLQPLRAAGFPFKYIHAANSAGTLMAKEAHFNAVRVGLAMYGLSPSDIARVPSTFRPVLSWKTVIAQVKTLPAGHPVGYGATYYAQANERIAVIPVGYSDGLRRAPHYWGYVLVRGQIAPIIGRVSMEKTTINVTNIPDVAIGDEVVLIGTQGGLTISADDIARRLGTISYEVLCGIAPRAMRR